LKNPLIKEIHNFLLFAHQNFHGRPLPDHGPQWPQHPPEIHNGCLDRIALLPGRASKSLISGVNYTIMRMQDRDARGMVQYYWSSIIGTERSIGFAALMRKEGFDRFEEALEEFRVRFDDKFLRRP
jgi:hypothetical protein